MQRLKVCKQAPALYTRHLNSHTHTHTHIFCSTPTHTLIHTHAHRFTSTQNLTSLGALIYNCDFSAVHQIWLYNLPRPRITRTLPTYSSTPLLLTLSHTHTNAREPCLHACHTHTYTTIRMYVQYLTVNGCACNGRRLHQQHQRLTSLNTVNAADGIIIVNYNYCQQYNYFDYYDYSITHRLTFAVVFVGVIGAPRQCRHPSIVAFHQECNRHRMCARLPRCGTKRRGRRLCKWLCCEQMQCSEVA